MKIASLVFLSIFCCGIFCCTSYATQNVITILIHGTVGLTETFNINTIHRLWRNTVTGSRYAKKVEKIRLSKTIRKFQPIQSLGLRHIRSIADAPGARIYANLYRTLAHHYGPAEKHIFYTFGWSGLAHNDARCKGASHLYRSLQRLVESIEERGSEDPVRIRIIAFSHGATLACHLADLRLKHSHDRFCIEELFCLGMPILNGTRERLLSPLFNNVYHLYSDADVITSLDIFSNNTFCSSRKFAGRLPKKIKQIRIRVMGPLRRNLGSGLPGRLRSTVDQSPNHMELWFFGTNNGINARQSLILNPLPISVFVPYIRTIANQYESECCSLTVELWPHKHKTLVRSCKRILSKERFLTINQLRQLQKKVCDFSTNSVLLSDKIP